MISEEWDEFLQWMDWELSKKYMSMLLSIISKVNERVIEAVKEFLKNRWNIRKQVSADMNEDGRLQPRNHTYGI